MDNNKELVNELIRTFHNFKRISWNLKASLSMKPSEFGVLYHIHMNIKKTPGGIRTTKISESMRMEPPSITPIINFLEDEGYVKRIRNKKDRRVVLIDITEKGKNYVMSKEEETFKDLERMVEFLGIHDTNELIRIMKRVIEFFIKNEK